MLKALLFFFLQFLCSCEWRPAWLLNEQAQADHFHRRRFTKLYQKKQRIVRSVWFTVLLLILMFPVPWFAISSALLTTFVSFCILDETQ